MFLGFLAVNLWSLRSRGALPQGWRLAFLMGQSAAGWTVGWLLTEWWRAWSQRRG